MPGTQSRFPVHIVFYIIKCGNIPDWLVQLSTRAKSLIFSLYNQDDCNQARDTEEGRDY